MKDKLAEEIIRDYFEPIGSDCTTGREDLQLAITLNPSIDKIIRAMQAYHEAKMKEVTDEDIEAWANRDRKKLIDDEVWTTAELKERIWGRVEGAKALRDGEIKHNREV